MGKNPPRPGTVTINRGKLLQHKLIHVQCTKKSTRVPVSPVLGDSKFRFLFAPFHRGDSKFRFLFAPFHRGDFNPGYGFSPARIKKETSHSLHPYFNEYFDEIVFKLRSTVCLLVNFLMTI